MATPENLLQLSSTESTNKDAYDLAGQGVSHGFAVIAESQVGGRGRLGREWISPPGTGLYCSVVLRPRLPFSEFPKLSLTAGLALCRSLENKIPGFPFGLKWPNDLYCSERKCGGILVESSSLKADEQDLFVIVGIGLNVNSQPPDFPTDLQKKVTSLCIQSGRVYDIEQLFYAIHASLLEHVSLHEEKGFSAILEEWRKRDILLGKEMQWVTRDRRLITGVGLGPDENGQLIARDSTGKLHEILSGDVQLAE